MSTFFYAEDVIGTILVGHLSAHSHQHCSNTHAVVECRIRIDQEAPLIVFLFVNKQWCTALCLLMGQDLALSRPLGARLRRYSCLPSPPHMGC